MYKITFNKQLYKKIKESKLKNNKNKNNKETNISKKIDKITSKDSQLLQEETILLGKRVTYYGKDDLKNSYNLKELKAYEVILFTIEKYDDYIKNLVDNLKRENKIIICYSDYNDIKRMIIEKVNFDFILNPHLNNKKQIFDFIHHFNSGLNHILAKLLKEKDKGLLITLNQFTRSNLLDKKNKFNTIKEIGRINQNLKLARKYNLRLLFDFFIETENNLKTYREIEEILKIFNLSTEQIKKNSKELGQRYKQNIFKNSDNYITKGIEVV